MESRIMSQRIKRHDRSDYQPFDYTARSIKIFEDSINDLGLEQKKQLLIFYVHSQIYLVQ